MATKALKKPPTTASTSIAVRPKAGGSVVSIQEALKAQAASMADRISPPGGSKIKLSPGQMALPDGTKTDTLHAVIVDFVSTNKYYGRPFNRDNPLPPVCFAIGDNPKTLAPSPNSPEPQAKSCAECEWNKFKSGDNGKGKACRNERKLALLSPDADESTPILVLEAGPTSIQSFDGYVQNVARTFGVGPTGVVTEISMNTTVDWAATLFGNPTPNENPGTALARQAEARDLLAVEPDLTNHVPLAATQKKGAVRAPARR
jgi:hypothetical protein